MEMEAFIRATNTANIMDKEKEAQASDYEWLRQKHAQKVHLQAIVKQAKTTDNGFKKAFGFSLADLLGTEIKQL
jgi:hypothetical protein